MIRHLDGFVRHFDPCPFELRNGQIQKIVWIWNMLKLLERCFDFLPFAPWRAGSLARKMQTRSVFLNRSEPFARKMQTRSVFLNRSEPFWTVRRLINHTASPASDRGGAANITAGKGWDPAGGMSRSAFQEVAVDLIGVPDRPLKMFVFRSLGWVTAYKVLYPSSHLQFVHRHLFICLFSHWFNHSSIVSSFVHPFIQSSVP